jgi:hypothetical protein
MRAADVVLENELMTNYGSQQSPNHKQIARPDTVLTNTPVDRVDHVVGASGDELLPSEGVAESRTNVSLLVTSGGKIGSFISSARTLDLQGLASMPDNNGKINTVRVENPTVPKVVRVSIQTVHSNESQ